MSWDKKEALNKVKKLLALSKSDSEHEAAQAVSMAHRILAKYNLCIEDLSEVAQEDLTIVRENVMGARRMPRWRTDLVVGVSKALGCAALVSLRVRQTTLIVVGTATDTQVAKETLLYLVGAINRLTKKNAKGKGRAFANGYRRGAVARIVSRLQEQVEINETELRKEATEAGTALVLRKEEELNNYMDQFRYNNTYTGGNAVPDGRGFNAGYSDGGSVSLNQQIRASA